MKYLCLMLTINLLWSCDNHGDFRKEKEVLSNQEIFYGLDTGTNDHKHLINLYSEALATGFKIPSIHGVDNEIRIYFNAPFRERFFRQVSRNDSTFIECFNCRFDKRNDSLFMVKQKRVYLYGTTSRETDFNGNLLKDSLYALNDKSDFEGPTVWFVQYKKGGVLKSVFYGGNPDSISEMDQSSFFEFIKEVEERYTFKFNSEFDTISINIGKNLIAL